MLRSACLHGLLLLLTSWGLLAQSPDPLAAAQVRERGGQLQVHPVTGLTSFLRFPAEEGLTLAGDGWEEKGQAFWQAHGLLFGVNDPETLALVWHGTDLGGGHHLRYAQRHRGLPVFAAELRLHFSGQGKLQAANGVYLPELTLDTEPTIAAAEAKTIVLQGAAKQPNPHLFALEPRLLVYHSGLPRGVAGAAALAYEVEVRDERDFRTFYYLDAQTGRLIDQLAGACHALDRAVYQGNTSTLAWEEGDPFPGSLNADQQNLVLVSEETYHFFSHAFGRDSYDNAGATMRAVAAASFFSSANANWNGSTTNYYQGTEVDDVIAHEWAHAYTEYTCNLIYQWQSGAINEALSDIWGETVDLLNALGNDTGDTNLRSGCGSSLRWRIGEDATVLNGPIRDMWDPTCNGHPGKVSDAQYHCQTSDNGGVHRNSGVPNHLYALLVDGGTYNGHTVTALGLTKAAHIFWRAQRYYLTRTSDFAALADALEAAAADLLGVDLPALGLTSADPGLSGEVIDAADVAAVGEAIAAVELRTAVSCDFEPLLEANPPDLCTDEPEAPAISLFMEDFESGASGWTATQVPNNPSTWDARDWTLTSSLPDGRMGAGFYGSTPYVGNCGSDLDNGIIRLESPVINLPANLGTEAYLSFDHYVSMEPAWDGGNLKYRRNGGNWTLAPNTAFAFNAYNRSLNPPGSGNDNPLAGQASFTGADGGSVSGSWGTSQVNLLALGIQANDQVQFRWELGTDGCNGWDGWYLDDVEVVTCSSAALPVQWLSFTAEPTEEAVLLRWSTAEARDNAGFALERSRHGLDFQQIAWIDGREDSQEVQSYQWWDRGVAPGATYYYRLRQEDLDGDVDYSWMVKVVCASGGFSWRLAPNPAGDYLHLTFSHALGRGARLSMQPMAGGPPLEIGHWPDGLAAGSNQTLSLGDWPSGVYLLRLFDGDHQYVERLLVTR